MKLLIDVPVQTEALAALRRSGRHEFNCIVPPTEKSGASLDPARLADVDVLFCTFPPKNFSDLKALRWMQMASAGYSQLFGLDLPARGIRATNVRCAKAGSRARRSTRTINIRCRRSTRCGVFPT